MLNEVATTLSHPIPIGTRVRCRIGDVRVGSRQVRTGWVRRHEFRHGVVPMYLVELSRQVMLVTGRPSWKMLFWESQLEPVAAATVRGERGSEWLVA